jgi:hypothetical protein
MIYNLILILSLLNPVCWILYLTGKQHDGRPCVFTFFDFDIIRSRHKTHTIQPTASIILLRL